MSPSYISLQISILWNYKGETELSLTSHAYAYILVLDESFFVTMHVKILKIKKKNSLI